MPKKTRKKSSKSAPGRSTAKRGGAKAAKSAAAKKASAKTPKRSGKKAAPAKKSVAPRKQQKPAAAPVRQMATLSEGASAPAFSLPRDGGPFVSLADYAGRKLVIFFYPRADTPGCTLEAIAFSRLANAFDSAGTAVLGVSADPVTAQEKFRDKHALTVPLVSDEELGMLNAYGVWGEKSMYGKTFMGISRTTVLIDGDGKVVRVWRNVKVDGHADEVLAAAQAA